MTCRYQDCISRVVCREITTYGWKHVGLLDTKWTMTRTVYAEALEKLKLRRLIPD
jgi:aspartate/glutamate racemase